MNEVSNLEIVLVSVALFAVITCICFVINAIWSGINP